MASSILSDNGVSSGSAGLKSAADSTGVLALQTTTAGGTATTALTIDTSQNVGIGTVSPTAKLQVNSGSGQMANFFGNNANNYIAISDNNGSTSATIGSIAGGNLYTYTAGYSAFYTGGAEKMRIDSSGNVGIGTSSPSTRLNLVGATNTGLAINDGTVNTILYNSSNAQGTVGTTTNHPMTFFTNNAERARIDSSGNLLVGTTSASGKFTVSQATSNAVAAGVYSTATSLSYCLDIGSNAVAANSTLIRGFSNTSTQVFNVAGTGNVTNTNNSYGAISDVKLKENITDATPKLAQLNQIRVVNYNLKSDPEHKQLGVIAQELEQVFPSMIEESPDRDAEGNDLGTTTKSVKYSVFVPMLIKAIQEQQALITAQAETINALTARIVALEGK